MPNFLRSSVFVLLVITSSAVSAQEYRTWTDATGEFKIEARLKGEQDGSVTLVQKDGTELEIEVKQLSAADQKFLADAKKANPFKPKPKTNNPFKKPTGSTTPAEMPEEPVASVSAREVKVDWSAVERIALSPTRDEWKIDAPARPDPIFTGRPKTVALPAKTNFFESMKGVAFNPTSRRAVVGYTLEDRRANSTTTRLVLCDLAAGRAANRATAPGLYRPVAIHEDGRRVVMCRDEFGFGKQDRLEIWLIQGSQVQKSLQWIPYEDLEGAGRDVMMAGFLDEDRLVTSSRSGRVTVWDFATAEPLYAFETADGAVPAISPNRRYLAYCDGSQFGLFDVETREVVVQRPTPERLTWPYMAFSPTGEQLCCIAQAQVLTWNATTGELLRQVPSNGLNIHGAIAVPADGYVLANNTYLIDTTNELKLWTYHGGEQAFVADGWTFFAVGDQKAGAMVPVKLPHPAAAELVKKALTDPNLFIVRAGTVVKIDTSGIPDASQRPAIEAHLKKRLEAIGCTAGANGTVVLAAKVTGPQQTEIHFFSSGDYNFQEYTSIVEFQYQNQPVWSSRSSNRPFVVSLKRGENMESHLRSLEKPSYTFFEGVELPKFVQKPSPNQQGTNNTHTLGQSQVTVNGVR